MHQPEPIYSITHPLIDAIYLKKEFVGKQAQDVLVIEVRSTGIVTAPNYTDPLIAVLMDIDLIKEAVEKKARKFDRLDIKY